MCSGQAVRIFGTHENGAHAPFMVVPISALVPLPDRLSFKAGAAIGCGTGTAWGGLRRLGDVGGQTLVVSGLGPVGLSAVMLASAAGARVVALDPVASRRAHALRMGAETALNPTKETVPAAVRELTHGLGAPLVIETSGASQAIRDGIDSLARWGRICLVGLGGEVRFPVLGLHARQISIMTAISMSTVQQRGCAQFIADRALPVDELYTHTWHLSQVVEAYQTFDRQDAGKGVFVFD